MSDWTWESLAKAADFSDDYGHHLSDGAKQLGYTLEVQHYDRAGSSSEPNQKRRVHDFYGRQRSFAVQAKVSRGGEMQYMARGVLHPGGKLHIHEPVESPGGVGRAAAHAAVMEHAKRHGNARTVVGPHHVFRDARRHGLGWIPGKAKPAPSMDQLVGARQANTPAAPAPAKRPFGGGLPEGVGVKFNPIPWERSPRDSTAQPPPKAKTQVPYLPQLAFQRSEAALAGYDGLAKRSKNVRERTKGLSQEEKNRRLSEYARRIGLDPQRAHDYNPQHQPQGPGNKINHDGTVAFGLQHELGHAVMTPGAEAHGEYTNRLWVPTDNILDRGAAEARRHARGEEAATETTERLVARRAGITPRRSLVLDPTRGQDTRQMREAARAKDAVRRFDGGARFNSVGQVVMASGVDAKINARAARKAEDGPDRKLLVLDFDGVLHSYHSGWKGADSVPDPPTPGAIEFLRAALRRFDVAIYSSRSGKPGGIEAMAAWLTRHGLSDEELAQIDFPEEKPAAHVSLDDRAQQFEGKWPDLDELEGFESWLGKSFRGLPMPHSSKRHKLLLPVGTIMEGTGKIKVRDAKGNERWRQARLGVIAGQAPATAAAEFGNPTSIRRPSG